MDRGTGNKTREMFWMKNFKFCCDETSTVWFYFIYKIFNLTWTLRIYSTFIIKIKLKVVFSPGCSSETISRLLDFLTLWVLDLRSRAFRTTCNGGPHHLSCTWKSRARGYELTSRDTLEFLPSPWCLSLQHTWEKPEPPAAARGVSSCFHRLFRVDVNAAAAAGFSRVRPAGF